MKRLLTIKHWQLFMLLLGIPLVFEFSMVGLVILNKNLKVIFIGLPIMMIICIGFFFSWFYALGTNLHRRLPENAKMNLTVFKIFLFVPAAYFLFLLIVISILNQTNFTATPNLIIFVIVFFMHLASMFCIFYCLYFIAKAFKSVESQKPVSFGDYIGEFLLFWLYPVGIWILQPRINKLFDPALEKGESNEI
jgi:hypothetical protein